MANRRGEGDDPAAANGLLHTLRAGGLDAPILPSDEPRWAQLRFAAAPGLDLRDRFRGALIGGAIGDALGRANEGVWPSEARARRIRDYQSWRGHKGGPKGTITDDTQMTMWLAESLLEAGYRGEAAGVAKLRQCLLDPDDLARRFTRERIRGIGQATREFVRNYHDRSLPWYEAGVVSAGNGTAMRAAPVGLVNFGDPYRIYRDSLLQSVVTHRDSMAIAAAACQAYATTRAAASPPGALASLASRLAFCADVAILLEGLERPGYERRGGSGATSLYGRIGTELPRYLEEGKTPLMPGTTVPMFSSPSPVPSGASWPFPRPSSRPSSRRWTPATTPIPWPPWLAPSPAHTMAPPSCRAGSSTTWNTAITCSAWPTACSI